MKMMPSQDRPGCVGFDVSPIVRGRTGVGNYCYYLLKHLLRQGGGLTYRGFSSGRQRPDLNSLDNGLVHRHVPVPTRVLYAAWERLGWPRVDGLLGGVDVYHATNFFLPPTRRARRVVTIHDLAFLAMPETGSPRIVGPFSRGIRRFAQEADAILAYSESTKRDIMHFLEVEPEKITVAPMAVDDGFTAMARDEATAVVRRDFGVEPPFLLFVSTLEPRKNVVGLIRALASIKTEIPHKMVLIGGVGWNAEPIFEAIRTHGLEERVVRPGFVPHEELPAFYCAADAFVFPTFYEGFGLPLLEALTCGCPVVTSANSSVPEVVGDAAVFADPRDPAAIGAAVLQVLGEAALRARLIEEGHAHAQRFSWAACAAATAGVYRSLIA